MRRVFTRIRPLEDQILIMTPATEAILSVEVLAYAFNMDKADFLNRVVIVDDLGGLEKEGVLMLMVDRDWFMCFDTFYTFTEQYNALHFIGITFSIIRVFSAHRSLRTLSHLPRQRLRLPVSLSILQRQSLIKERLNSSPLQS